MNIETERLPKGMGYACRPPVLDAAIEAAAIDIEWTLGRRASGPFFDCHFGPKNPNVAHERLYFRAAAVQSAAVGSARIYLEAVILPEALAWAKSILAQPLNSTVRREEQYFSRDLPRTPAQN